MLELFLVGIFYMPMSSCPYASHQYANFGSNLYCLPQSLHYISNKIDLSSLPIQNS
jgi:hypothetical protein